jgi:hypothetical protein
MWEGVVRAASGDPAGALDPLEAALAAYRAGSDPLETANAARFLAMAAVRAGDPARALAAAEEARAAFVAAGHRAGAATATNTLADVTLAAGDLEAAEAHFLAARDELRRLGSSRAVVPESGLGLVLLRRGRADEARELLEAVASSPACASRPPFHATVRALVLAAVAASGELDGYGQHLQAAADAIAAGGCAPGTAVALRTAAATMRAAGRDAEAALTEDLMHGPPAQARADGG